MDWISSGFNPVNPLSRTIPSITYNGSLLRLIEPEPRTRILTVPPGAPLFCTCTPATRPCKASDTCLIGWSLKDLLLNTDTDPAKSALRTVP